MIGMFRGHNRLLSNFWIAPVDLDGFTYRTVEHAYQAAKTLDDAERAIIRRLGTPGEAKRAGKNVTMRDDWKDVRLEIMEDLVRQKFAPGTFLAIRLKETGDQELVEDNTWEDVYWGVCRGRGQNNLGKILMKIREELNAVRTDIPCVPES